MSKNKINVIDLDQTLIPYDSYDIYIRWPLYNLLYYLPGVLLIIFRKFRIISLSTQKKYSIILNQRINGYHKYVEQFADKILNDIDDKVLKMVAEETDEATINILCTASPYDYAGLLATKLNWECVASHWSNNSNNFIHVYDSNKVSLINEYYPIIEYDYNFAISDSLRDSSLLAQFKKSILYNNV